LRSGEGVAISAALDVGTPVIVEDSSGEFQIAERDPNAPGFLKSGALEYVGEHYLKFRDGPYWIKSGTNSPENLLGYAGIQGTTDQGGIEVDFLHEFAPHIDDASSTTDPFFSNSDTGIDSRGLTGAINYLSSAGVNSVYFLPLNLGGDGQDTFPYLSPVNTREAKTHFDLGKLYQWSQIFEHAQRQGILLHVVLAETEIANERWLDDGSLGLERRLFLREMVARYAFALGLKWNLSEENDYPVEFLRQTSDYISSLYWANKRVVVHTHIENFDDYEALQGESRLAATSIQYTIQSAGEIVELWRERSQQSGQPWVIDMDENTTALGPENATFLRKQALYDIYFSGGNVEWFMGYAPLPVGGDVNVEDFRTRDQMWRFTRIAREFMEQHLPFWEMSPDDSLVSGEGTAFGGAEVFAKEGAVYAVYLPQAGSDGNASLDLSAAQGDMFEKHWFNPETGEFDGGSELVEASSSSPIGVPPARLGDDWVVLFTRIADAVVADTISDSPEEIEEIEDSVAALSDASDSPQVFETPAVEISELAGTAEGQVADDSVIADPITNPIENPIANSAPRISDLPDNFFVESGIPIEFIVSAIDPDGQVPSIYLVNAPDSSDFSDNGDGTRTFTWLPSATDNSTHGITVVAVDALDTSLRDAREIVINVTVPQQVESSQVPDAVAIALSPTGVSNQPPEVNLPNSSAIPVGTSIDLVFLPIDPEGVVPSLWIERLPEGASFVDNGNGTRSLQWTPQPEDRGSYPLVLIVADGRNPELTSRQEFLLEIVSRDALDSTDPDLNVSELVRAPVNQPPVFPALDESEVSVGQQFELDVLPRDPEGLAPVLHVQNAPESSSFDDNGSGGRRLSWTPGGEDVGVHFLRFIAIDAADSSLSTEVIRKITVIGG